MGLGTGVLRAYYVWYLVSGLTVGIAGTSSLYIARRTGVPQNWLIASRGIGQSIGPILLSKIIGKAMWSGESQSCVALAFVLKAVCAFIIPRASSGWLLYTCFFSIGIARAVLDTLAIMLVTRIHGKGSGAALSTYDALYGIGCMIAPFVTVMCPGRCWDLLAGIDLMVAVALGRKRTVVGKPQDWKSKIRSPEQHQGESNVESQPPEGQTVSGTPSQVIIAGMVFIAVSQIASTSISAWSFTFAVVDLHLMDKFAAMVSSAFFFAASAARFLLVYVSRTMPASTILQFSTLLIFGGASMLSILCKCFFDEVTDDVPQSITTPLYFVICCLAIMGIGYCPHYSLVLAAMQQHGNIGTSGHAWYASSTNIGITIGLWLPGMVKLPVVELLAALVLLTIMSSNRRYFPWRPVS